MKDTIVIGGSISLKSAIDGSPDKFMAVYPESYMGETEILPSEEEQILSTEGYYMSKDIIISPIPSNYGRIAYSGGIITVY